MKTYRILSLFVLALTAFSWIRGSLNAAALPDSLPTNASDARIYALTHTVKIQRQVWAYPAGQIQLYSIAGNPIDVSRDILVPQPSSAENLMKVTNADKFRFSLPTAKIGANIMYRGLNSSGLQTLVASTSFNAVETGNPASPWALPPWAQGINYDLSDEFKFELDANLVSIAFINPETNEVEYKNLFPTLVGGHRFFTIPTWWFDRADYVNGLTFVYGLNEFRQYENSQGRVAGIKPISFEPVAGVYNHFQIFDSPGNITPAFISVQSWANQIEDPSYEYRPVIPEATQKVLMLNVQTTDGAKPISVKVTEQDRLGNLTSWEVNMLDDANYSKVSVNVIGGKAYYFKFGWSRDVQLVRPRG